MAGSPAHPVGHLQTALWPNGVHWAFLPQGKPLSQGLTHWCWLQARLSGHSESLSHSPTLTRVRKSSLFSNLTRRKNSYTGEYSSREKLTRSTLSVWISCCSWWAIAHSSMVGDRTPGWLTTRIVGGARIHTASWNTCLEWWTFIIWWAARFNWFVFTEKKETAMLDSLHVLMTSYQNQRDFNYTYLSSGRADLLCQCIPLCKYRSWFSVASCHTLCTQQTEHKAGKLCMGSCSLLVHW